MNKAKRQAKKMAIGIAGGVVLIAGVIMIPYPGPGWLVVISGLAILATEFHWARRGLNLVKHYYEAWEAWTKRQRPYVRALLWLATAAVVVVTIWLVNGFGLWAMLFGWDIPWAYSPFLK